MTTHSRLSLLRRIRELANVASTEGFDAETVVGTALSVWRQADYPALKRPLLRSSRALAQNEKLRAFVEALRSSTFLEGTYWLSSAYAMLSDYSYRKDLAIFFTPPSLTEGLLNDLSDQGVDFTSQRFLDPACGGAAFLAPIALRMRDALAEKGLNSQQILEHVELHLQGTDLDETLCELSRQFLCMALYREIQSAKYQPRFKVRKANSLTLFESYLGKIDVVVCNPPYRKVAWDELENLRRSFGDVIDAQPNLYGLFICLCVQVLKQGGYAALVTPTSFLSGQNFSKLRDFLLRDTDIAHVGMVSDRIGVFIDVEQETALTVLRRRNDAGRQRRPTKVSVVTSEGEYLNMGECRLPGNGAAWPIPRSADDVTVLAAASTSPHRLGSYGYRIRIGAYVWNRDGRPRFDSLSEVKRAKCKTALPLLWSRDIAADGTVSFDGKAKGGGEHRFVDLGDKLHPSAVTKPSVILQRVTSNDQPKRLVAAPVPLSLIVDYGGFVGENHVVILEQVVDEPELLPDDLAKLLGATPIDRCFRCISGATNVSAFELSQLALPDPKQVKKHLKKGSSMEEAVYRSYGLVSRG